MEIGTCNLTEDEVTAVLQKEKTIILATAADNRVTTRSMSHVNCGMTIYFQTGSNYLKCQQIRINPNVAISVEGYDIEGKTALLGHPLDEENSFFIKLYKEKHPEYSGMWSTYPEEIVVRVDIEMVRKWRYVDGKPFIAVWKKDGVV
jgi:general stress protein 26